MSVKDLSVESRDAHTNFRTLRTPYSSFSAGENGRTPCWYPVLKFAPRSVVLFVLRTPHASLDILVQCFIA